MPLLWILFLLSAASAIAQADSDSLRCYAMCRYSPVYVVDTLRVVDVPARKKTIRIPEVYEVNTDSLIDESVSVRKPYPPLHEVSYNKRGEATYKRVTPTGDSHFYLKRILTAVDQKKLLTAADVTTVELPPSYVTVYERRLAPLQPEPRRVEVLCEENLTKAVVQHVQRLLTLQGYKPGTTGGEVTPDFLESLECYQADHGLPLCGFNIPTLEHLGVH